MERFVTRHHDRIVGILTGFDRMIFRGTLRSISYVQGLEIFLARQRVLLKEFGAWAEHTSKQLKAHAEHLAVAAGRPFEYLASPAISKEDRARAIMKRDGITEGLICVLSCVEPCRSFDLHRNRSTKRLELRSADRKCLFLYFYLVDRDFGFMHLRLQTWLPLTIQVYINGREYLARQLDRLGVPYTRQENAFHEIADWARAQQILDRLTTRHWARLLTAWARRINPWLARRAGWDLHGYYWSLRQSEHATDVAFRDRASLAAVYPRLVRHAFDHFTSDHIFRFLGRRLDGHFRGESRTHHERRAEGICLKHWVDENSIKMYDKHGVVLRVETTMNNPRRFKVRRRATRRGQRVAAWLPLRKGVIDLPRRVEITRAANGRYLDALSVVGDPTPSHHLLDPVSRPIVQNGRRYRALRPITPEESLVFRTVLRGEHHVQGLRHGDLQRVLADPASTPRRLSARVSRCLRRLRAHGLIQKVGHTRYYRVTPKGQQVMSTALAFRDTDIALLAA